MLRATQVRPRAYSSLQPNDCTLPSSPIKRVCLWEGKGREGKGRDQESPKKKCGDVAHKQEPHARRSATQQGSTKADRGHACPQRAQHWMATFFSFLLFLLKEKEMKERKGKEKRKVVWRHKAPRTCRPQQPLPHSYHPSPSLLQVAFALVCPYQSRPARAHFGPAENEEESKRKESVSKCEVEGKENSNYKTVRWWKEKWRWARVARRTRRTRRKRSV